MRVKKEKIGGGLAASCAAGTVTGDRETHPDKRHPSPGAEKPKPLTAHGPHGTPGVRLR